MVRRLIAAVAVALMVPLIACSMSADAERAEQAVTGFHQMLDAAEFETIYDASADDLKKATTREKFIAFLAAVHRKLGGTRSAKQQGWNVNYHTSGTFVTLTYATSYERGEAVEQFVYRVRAEHALLAGYHINSEALILN